MHLEVCASKAVDGLICVVSSQCVKTFLLQLHRLIDLLVDALQATLCAKQELLSFTGQ